MGRTWEYISLTDTEIGTEEAQFLSWDYLFRIFGIVYLQCVIYMAHMEIGTEAAQFLFWEYINPNFFAVHVVVALD